jgi:hypothetical protein
MVEAAYEIPADIELIADQVKGIVGSLDFWMM